MGAVRGVVLSAGSSHIYSRNVGYICRICRETISQSQLARQQIRLASSSNLPWTEKLRRRIWGTDNPPGLKDPYGGPGFFERRAQRRNAERSTTDGNQRTTTTIETAPVKEATPETESYLQSQAPREQGLKPTPRDLPPENLEKYVPAETWDNLEHMGTAGDWRSIPENADELPPSWRAQFLTSATTTQLLDYTSLVSCMHQAIVESLACKEAGQPLPNYRYSADEAPAVIRAKIIVSADGTISHLEYASEDDQETFVNIISTAESSGKKSSPHSVNNITNTQETTVTDAETMDTIPIYSPEEQAFLDAKLDFSSSLTFTILKRFSGLSGITIPDPLINTVRSSNKPLSHLLHQLAKFAKPKPKNLAQTLAESSTLLKQKNIMILPRRETPVDKEKEVGRWKVIEKELNERGLPVLGRVQL